MGQLGTCLWVKWCWCCFWRPFIRKKWGMFVIIYCSGRVTEKNEVKVNSCWSYTVKSWGWRGFFSLIVNHYLLTLTLHESLRHVIGKRLCFLTGTVQPPIWQAGNDELKCIANLSYQFFLPFRSAFCLQGSWWCVPNLTFSDPVKGAQVIWETERAQSLCIFYCFASTSQPTCISQSWTCHADCFWLPTVDILNLYPLDWYRTSWSANMIMENHWHFSELDQWTWIGIISNSSNSQQTLAK